MIDVGTQTNAHDQLFLQEYVNDEIVIFNDDSDVFEDEIIVVENEAAGNDDECLFPE